MAFDALHQAPASPTAARLVTLDDVPDVQVRWADCPEPAVLRGGACVRTETIVRLPHFNPPPPPAPAPVTVHIVVKKKTTTTHRHHEEEEGEEEGEHEGGEH